MLRLARLGEESGSVIVVFLLLVSLFLGILVGLVKLVQIVSLGDVVLKESVALAVKAAATYAEKKDFHRAQVIFENILEENLKMRKNMKPQDHSGFSGLEYKLIVYNGGGGKNGKSESGKGKGKGGNGNGNSPAGVIYEFRDGILTVNEIMDGGFPRKFTLSGGVKVELSSPGAVAEVTAKPVTILGEVLPCKRWAAAEMAMVNGKPAALLVGRKQ